MKKKFIFVTGFFGSPIKETAAEIAKKNGGLLLSLDDEIVKTDGRSIMRICMLMGEHEYRNKEYEAINNIMEKYAAESADSGDSKNSPKDLETVVVYCGDGVLLDGMSRQLIEQHTLIIAGWDMTADQLWENTKNEKDSYHAFMTLKEGQRKLSAFHDLYQRQLLLYNNYCK